MNMDGWVDGPIRAVFRGESWGAQTRHGGGYSMLEMRYAFYTGVIPVSKEENGEDGGEKMGRAVKSQGEAW
jgi:hypothetical protein